MRIPITHSITSLTEFLVHIRTQMTPSIITPSYIKQNGFNSSHDTELIQIARILGFVDDEGRPTSRWEQYRQTGAPVLQEAIRECYQGLFALYPDEPYAYSDTDLRAWFREPVTSNSESSIVRAIRTFRRLCELAQMNAETKPKLKAKTIGLSNEISTAPSPQPSDRLQPQLIIQLPVLTTEAQYIELLQAIRTVFYE